MTSVNLRLTFYLSCNQGQPQIANKTSRLGIGAESCLLSMAWGKALGAGAAAVSAVAHKSQALFRDKLGFNVLKVN